MAKNILVVEDNAGMRETLLAVLESEGYGVVTAEHGERAQQILKEIQPLPDLILLDLQMPVMDGETFIRTLPSTNVAGATNIPIVAVTASRLELDAVVEALRKPFGLDELLAVVQRYIGPSSNKI